VLCAAWCTTCREFAAVFERLAAARPSMRFVWLDIEDDSDRCGDIEVDNFPTLAVFRRGALLHFGPCLPQEPAVARLLDALAVDDRQASRDAPLDVARLADLFNDQALRRSAR
jgi:thioredoxin reductase (NADPH)